MKRSLRLFGTWLVFFCVVIFSHYCRPTTPKGKGKQVFPTTPSVPAKVKAVTSRSQTAGSQRDAPIEDEDNNPLLITPRKAVDAYVIVLQALRMVLTLPYRKAVLAATPYAFDVHVHLLS